MGRITKFKLPESVGSREKKYVERTTGEQSFLQSAESGATVGRTQAKHNKPHARLGSKGEIKIPHKSVKPKGAY